MALPNDFEVDSDVPGDYALHDINWHASATKLSNLVSDAVGQSVEYTAYPEPNGIVRWGSHGPAGSSDFSIEAEQRVLAICADPSSWLIYRDIER